ncbi:DNA topoisomerase III [Verrucomicrobiaceae bacterium N1E253]|uniref:DNA topoisomerase n=1 Tax=Oceaniferula marina TaxID=2748318 RepID=A0A851GDC4_9BACT|nr:DNA topoisomerase III [Oceaniferula marina]NWK55758.1 DNA topoisomerase III [Oceaniferula marina]
MPKTLIIAEKPSVATDLSRALAKAPGIEKFGKKGQGRNTYFENDTHVITSAVGHLVELKMPQGPIGKNGKARNLPWNFEVLPAIPQSFQLQPIEQSESRLKLVLRLARRKDVDTIVNACDAGREGELIFRYILELGKVDKPVKRLWMQSMTQNAILEAWASLRSDEDMHNLRDAAKCRSESDWLVGLNATRALTCFRSRHGGFNITAAGRVQTPTLAILAKREMEIREFIPEAYAEVHADFAVEKGSYAGRWFNESWKKDPAHPHSKAERIWDKENAETIRSRCEGKTGTVSETQKPTKQASPQLYDLTTLQREASSRYGFSARRTLQLAQSLYEKYKMLTYPRTDSRYLPEDYLGTVHGTIQSISEQGGDLGRYAKQAIDQDLVKPSKRIFNNAKISDHFAIIPTGRFVKLDEAAQKIFDLVAKRFLAVFYPHAEFLNTRRITRISHPDATDAFLTTGKILVTPGWLAIYGRQPGVAAGKDDLCAVSEGESAQVTDIEVKHDETKPPARFNEATLLSAMEGAGKLIDDDELREAMADRGLGTPATRAATIEGLIRQKYIERDGREIHVTRKGLSLIDLTQELGIDALASPSMTGDWESKLHQMEHGQLTRPEFMQEIIGFTSDIVNKAKTYTAELKNKVFPDLLCPCPVCQTEPMKTTDATYQCSNPECGFQSNKYIASRELKPEEAIQLFTTKLVGPFDDFKSRFNRPFEAVLELKQETTKSGKPGKWKVNFVFDDGEDEKDELSDEHIVATVTTPDGSEVQIYEMNKAWHVPAITTKNDPDGIRISRTILKHEIPRDQAIKLIQLGKTDLIPGFISRKTRRPFSAYLTFDHSSGKVGFEFEPRKKAAKKAAKKSAKKNEEKK